MQIRAIETSDYSQILDLFNEFALFEKLPEKMTNSLDRMIKETDFFKGFVAVEPENRIVGYATYFFGYYTWIGKSLYMDDLYVKPEFRGQGIGSRLINEVIQFARHSACHKVRWQVSKWNAPAIAFYEKLGATIESTEQNCDLIIDKHIN